jgi:hypothetical protein
LRMPKRALSVRGLARATARRDRPARGSSRRAARACCGSAS